jgi:hypothetical protein
MNTKLIVELGIKKKEKIKENVRGYKKVRILNQKNKWEIIV